MAVTDDQIRQWWEANKGQDDAFYANAMDTHGVDPTQFATAIGQDPADILGRYTAATQPVAAPATPPALTAYDYLQRYGTARNTFDTTGTLRGLWDANSIGADNIEQYPEEFGHLSEYDLSPESLSGADQQLTDLYTNLGLSRPEGMTPEQLLEDIGTNAGTVRDDSLKQFYETLHWLEAEDPAAFNQQMSAMPWQDQLKYDYLQYTNGRLTEDEYSTIAKQRLANAGVSEFQTDANGDQKQLNLFNGFTNSNDVSGIGQYTQEVKGPSALERLTSNPVVQVALALVPGAGPWLSAAAGGMNMAASGEVTWSNALQVVGGVTKGLGALKDAGGTLSVVEQQAADTAYEAGFKVFQETGDAALATAAETAALKALQPSLLDRIVDGVKNIGWDDVGDAAKVISGLPSFEGSDQPPPEPVPYQVDTSQYPTRDMGTPEEMRREYEDGQITIQQLPDGTWQAMDKEGYVAPYEPPTGGGGGGGGGDVGGTDAAPEAAPEMPDLNEPVQQGPEPGEYVVPNHSPIPTQLPDMNGGMVDTPPAWTHTNPDGSVVAGNDMGEVWEVEPAPTTPPTDVTQADITGWLIKHPDATWEDIVATAQANNVPIEDVQAAQAELDELEQGEGGTGTIPLPGVDLGGDVGTDAGPGTDPVGTDTAGEGIGTGSGTGTGTGTGNGDGNGDGDGDGDGEGDGDGNGDEDGIDKLLRMFSVQPGGVITTKPGELAKIDNIYDFESIFASPEQEAMYLGPYQGYDATDYDALLELLRGD